MTVTPFGLIIAVIGFILLLRAKVQAVFWLMIICTAFGGSAALLMPALGGASVPPAQFAVIFLVARCLLPGSGQYEAVADALRANVLLGAFTAYGIVTAFIAPHLFEGTMQVVSLRYQAVASLFATTALAPSPQNVTTTVYLVGTFLTAVTAYVALRDRQSALTYVKVAVIIVAIHTFFGVTGSVLKNTGYDAVIAFFRNANYAQNDQSIHGIVRINGIWPEASSYAAYGFDWFVLVFECWFRNVLPKWTGPAAALMVLVLFLSTSSTAYGALTIYFAIFLARVLISPKSLPASKGLAIAGAALMVIIIIALICFLFPAFATLFWKLLLQVTVNKQGSDSGLQRAFWAKTGLNAFVASWGIGIGPGSFRSSTITTAMIGSVGVIGTTAFLLHVIRVLKPLRISTYYGDLSRVGIPSDVAGRVGAAASWAVVAVLIETALIAPTCDPGTDFGVFAGAALALRTRRKGAPVAAPVPTAPRTASWLGDLPPLSSDTRGFRP